MPDKAWGNGFSSDVCEGCRFHELREKMGQEYWACGLCGCPTAPGMPMDLTGAPPSDCPYLDLHAEGDGDGGDGGFLDGII